LAFVKEEEQESNRNAFGGEAGGVARSVAFGLCGAGPTWRAFRKLSVAEPLIVELREWSRIDNELKVERGRLTNGFREQLWRYYPP
jgi:hypothetical protein